MSKDNARLVEVIWQDSGQQMATSWAAPGLVASRAAELDTRVKTVGYILDETNEYILIAQSIDMESGNVAAVMRIVKTSVVADREL